MTAILGGGITGLSAAYYALENQKLGSIVLYEASNRLGGWVQSIKSPSGATFEKGPRTIRPKGIQGANTLELITKLNLDDKVIPINIEHPSARNRLIYANKKLHILPNSLVSIFKKQEPLNRPLISVIWNDLRAPKITSDDESIYSFVERRLGKDVADYFISPMICGICAGNAKDISVNFLAKGLFDYEQKYGSITKGVLTDIFNNFTKNKKPNIVQPNLVNRAQKEKWSVWGLQGGLEQLPMALKEHITSNKNMKINMLSECETLTFKPDHVELMVNGKVESHSRVISSLSANNLAVLLKRQHPQLSRELEAIPFSTVAVVNLHYTGNILPMEAFGFLVPPKENLPILGVIFDSCVFPNNSNTVLTVMMGGAWFQKYFADSSKNEDFLSTAVSHVKQILNVKDNPIEYDVAVLKNCIPQYIVGHNRRIERINNYISAHKIPLVLCGSSYHGVGLNDVILSARSAVFNQHN